jgi:hypothetical protein
VVFTVTVYGIVVEQLPFETVTVYAVVVIGVTVIEAVVAPLLHKYVPPPVAVSVVDTPEQTVFVPLTVTTGVGTTVTVALEV